jgi:hypothetical protein
MTSCNNVSMSEAPTRCQKPTDSSSFEVDPYRMFQNASKSSISKPQFGTCM